MVNTLLVTGMHREELGFGDRVAERVDKNKVEILRVPLGISHERTGTDDEFYYLVNHRELYLQLRQQVKRRYVLVIDLHCGLSDGSVHADVFSHDDSLLKCMGDAVTSRCLGDKVKLIKIIGEEGLKAHKLICAGHPGARTWIPEEVWNNHNFVYVGLEVYLSGDETGTAEECSFACELVEVLQSCRN